MYSVWACTTCGHLRSSLRDPVARNCPHQQLPQMCWKQKFLSHQNGKGACSSKQCKKNGITVYVELICFCMPKLRVAINSAVVGDVQKCTKTLQLYGAMVECLWVVHNSLCMLAKQGGWYSCKHSQRSPLSELHNVEHPCLWFALAHHRQASKARHNNRRLLLLVKRCQHSLRNTCPTPVVSYPTLRIQVVRGVFWSILRKPFFHILTYVAQKHLV